MIDAKELRIGNFIRWRLGGGQLITGRAHAIEKHKIAIGEDENGIGYMLLQGIEPIPLTEEWLLKFGFEQELLEEENPSEGYFYSLALSDDVYCDLEILSGDRSGFMEVYLFPYDDNFRFKYVHQLQNIYFVLTGKELTYEKHTVPDSQ